MDELPELVDTILVAIMKSSKILPHALYFSSWFEVMWIYGSENYPSVHSQRLKSIVMLDIKTDLGRLVP